MGPKRLGERLFGSEELVFFPETNFCVQVVVETVGTVGPTAVAVTPCPRCVRFGDRDRRRTAASEAVPWAL